MLLFNLHMGMFIFEQYIALLLTYVTKIYTSL